MKLSVQSIHQIAELNITSRSKVTQEEDLTWNWVLHLITERTNFVDEGVDHFRRFEVGGSLHYKDTLDDPNFNTLEIEHVRVKLNHVNLGIGKLHTVLSLHYPIMTLRMLIIKHIYKGLIITTILSKVIQPSELLIQRATFQVS
jgi:hypothetical protein